MFGGRLNRAEADVTTKIAPTEISKMSRTVLSCTGGPPYGCLVYQTAPRREFPPGSRCLLCVLETGACRLSRAPRTRLGYEKEKSAPPATASCRRPPRPG